jgi:hypothetical protein
MCFPSGALAARKSTSHQKGRINPVTPIMLDSITALNVTNAALGIAVAGLLGYVVVAFVRGLIRHRRREARG